MNLSINQKLRWGAMVIATVIFVFIGLTIFLAVSLQQADQRQQFAQKITELSFQTLLLRNEYSVRSNDRPKIQWISAHEALLRLFDEATPLFARTPEKELFENARSASLENGALFGELVNATEQGENPELVELLNNQMVVNSQARVSNVLRLSELARGQAEQAITVFEIIVVVFGIIILIIISLFYAVSRSVAESLRALNEDFTKLSTLDFSTTTTTTTDRNDELGALARAFNTMVAKLKEAYETLDDRALKLKVLAKEKESVRHKLAETAEELRLKAEATAVIAEEKERVRRKLVVTTAAAAAEKALMVDKLAREEKLAVLGKLAGIMGHEIRNPLGVIRNSIYFLTMKFGESMDEKVKRHMDILRSEIDGADKIISDVLEFARTEPLYLAEAEINSVVKAVLSKDSIPKTIKVEANLGKSLPKINIDIAQVKQVFSNIISNAIEAMPKGGELRVTTSQTGTFISIAFQDTGAGIPKENISRLFEPLFSTKAKGLGLGLVACQNIISAHQGKIEFESKEGKGATFTVTLPIYKN